MKDFFNGVALSTLIGFQIYLGIFLSNTNNFQTQKTKPCLGKELRAINILCENEKHECKTNLIQQLCR